MSIFIWRFFLKNEKNRNIYGGHIQYLFTNDTGYTDALNPETEAQKTGRSPFPEDHPSAGKRLPACASVKDALSSVKQCLCSGIQRRAGKSFRINLSHISSESFFRNFDRNRAFIIIIDLHAQIIHCQIDLRCLSLVI